MPSMPGSGTWFPEEVELVVVLPPEVELVVLPPQCLLQPPEVPQPPLVPHVAIAGEAMAIALTAAKAIIIFFITVSPTSVAQELRDQLV